MRAIFKSQQTIAVEGFRVIRTRQSDVTVTVYARVTDAEGQEGVSIQLPLSLQLAEALRLKLEQNL
jgi:hypothetical protein